VAALSSGFFGASVIFNLYVTLLVYFYLPPDSAGLPQLVTDKPFLGILNALALIAAVGRFTDSVTDVLIATWSDRSTHKRGRRIPFMAVGMVPAAVATVLVFVPPVRGESGWNILYLVFIQIVLFTFLTAYITPMFALVVDIGNSPKERLSLTCWSSVTWALGMVVSALTFFIAGYLKGIMEPLAAWQTAIVAVITLALVTMVPPVCMIDERKWSHGRPVSTPLLDAVRTALGNRFYRIIIIADFVNTIGLSMIQTGMLYYVTVLLQLEEWMATVLILALVAVSLVLYPVVSSLARRWNGGKHLLVIAFLLGSAVFGFAAVMGLSRKVLYAQAVVPIVAFALPYAVLTSMFFWITSDIAEHASRESKVAIAGTFYATRTFFQKLAATVGVILFALLLQLGRDVGDDLGVRTTGAVGAGLYVLAAIIISFYDERTLQRELHEMEALPQAAADPLAPLP
jgi:glycoside/pentoside/hexuronide:cation symporter, GPH family